MINFNLKFATNDKGFTPSKAQQDAFKLAAKQWGTQFANDATIDLTVESESVPFSNRLMSAQYAIGPKPASGFGDIGVARNKVLTGKDLNGGKTDARVKVNWGKNWELDFNETPNAAENEFDFYSTVYHELNHTLGFLSEAGSLDPYGTVFTQPGAWGAFDQYLTDSKGNSVFNSDNSLDFLKFNALKNGGSSQEGKGLFFSGPNAKAANGGRGVGLYTPSAKLSSPSHVDDDNPALSKLLMAATTPPGLSARSLSDVEKGIFKDLGYSFDSASNPGNKDNPGSIPSPTPEALPTFVEVPSLGGGNTIMLNVDQVGLSGLGELSVFSADDVEGTNKKQIASFSVLEGGKLPNDYDPSFTLDKDEISAGKFLQFDLAEEGKQANSATPKVLDGGQVSLDFDGGTQLSFEPATQSAKTNFLLDDAATIDLSQQQKTTKISFDVYRDAAYNNTVGLYKTDTADGVIVLDPILGTRVRPGEAGYKEAAMARKLDTMLTGENDQVKTFSTTVEDTKFLGTFLIANSADLMSEDIYFSHGAANRNNNDRVKMLGNNTFGFEDMPGLGDKDYNDFVVSFDIA
ncbi:MAG: DUF4114 domain-containing protein [Cyanobacteria bacterium J06634_5]